MEGTINAAVVISQGDRDSMSLLTEQDYGENYSIIPQPKNVNRIRFNNPPTNGYFTVTF